MMILVKDHKYIYRVLQFIGDKDGTRAVVCPLFDINWKVLEKVGEFGSSYPVAPGKTYKNRIDTILCYSLYVIEESEMPKEVLRDIKIDNILL